MANWDSRGGQRADGHQLDQSERMKVDNDGLTNNKWKSRSKINGTHVKGASLLKERVTAENSIRSWSSGKLSRCSVMEARDNVFVRSRDTNLPVLTAMLTAILLKKNCSTYRLNKLAMFYSMYRL